MQRELIKIDLSQLRTGAPVAREIYLKMPRNGKMLRIAWRSDEISPELLLRLQATPSAELYALPLEGDAEDAASLPLFGDLAKIRPTREAASADLEPALALIKPELPSKADDASEQLPSVLEEISPKAKADAAAEEKRSRKDNFVSEDFADVGATPAEEAASSFARDAEAPDDQEEAFEADDEDLYARDPKERREPEVEEEGLLARRRREAAESLAEANGNETEEQPQESPLSRKRREAEEVNSAAPEVAAPPPEEEGLLARKRREAESAFQISEPEPTPASATAPSRRLSLVPREEEAAELEAAGEPVPLPEVAKSLAAVSKSYSDKSGESHRDEVRLAALLDEASEELFRLGQGDDNEAARASLASKLEACRAEISRQERDGAEPVGTLRALNESLSRVTKVLAGSDATGTELAEMSGKLVESFDELQSTIAKEERIAAAALGRELTSVAEVLTAFASGDTGGDEALFDLRERISACLDETETRISAGEAPDEQLITIKASLKDALKALPYTSRAAKAYRDTPLIASRLAAQLAHSLGYANPAYLGDLALSTWLFFAAKNGAPVELQDPPPLVNIARDSMPGEDSAGTPAGDLAAILAFLDRYFDNPDCDRTRKDFSPRAFESTLRELENGENPPDALAAAQWRYFVGKGMSMNGESLCSRASSKAAKLVRAQAPIEKPV